MLKMIIENVTKNRWMQIVWKIGACCILVLILLWRSDLKQKYSMKRNEGVRITGLILARCGSKGVPKKNLSDMYGKSLIQNTLQVMTDFGKFDAIWVSTDCQETADNARKFNKAVNIHMRASYTATDEASSILGVKEFLEYHPEVEVVALVQCTSPFIRKEWLNEAYHMIERNGYSSVFSVTRQRKLIWEYLEDGTVGAVNFDPSNRPRRQDWNGLLIENGMFYFSKVNLIKEDLLQGGRIGVVEIPVNQSIEIDTNFDLQLSRNIYKLLNES